MALFKKAPAAKAGKKTSDSPIIVAADLPDPDTGAVKYSKEQVIDAVRGFAEGKELEKQGQTLMETHKPLLSEFARTGFSKLWAAAGTRPRSPKITTNADGTGTQITMSFIDKSSLMNDEQYADLVNLVGVANAEDAVERFTQYSIDAKLASQEVEIGGVKATFQEHMETALVSYFPEQYHDTIGAMLKPKEVFQTKKGLLDRGLDMVGRGSAGAWLKLAQFLVTARVITAYKPGAVGEDD